MELFQLFGSVFLKDDDVAKKLNDIDDKAKNTDSGFKNLTKTFEGFGSKATEIGKKTIAATLVIGALGVAAFGLASDYNESLNKVDVAFKNNAQTVVEWSNTSLKSYGIAKGSALEMASLFGDMGTSMGIPTGEAANMSTSLVGLAGDLSSFKNVRLDVAQDALKGIFTGEGESLKSLGVIMQDSTLNAYAHAQGTKTSYSEMTQAEKVQLRYNYVMDATKNAQGDFAKTSDGSANSVRIMQESMKELGTTLGQQLLPVITPIIQKITEWVQKFTSLDSGTKNIILVVAGIVAVLPPLLILIGSVATGIGVLSAAFGALTLTTGIWIAAIVAVIAIAVLIVKNWEPIKGFFSGLWEGTKEVFAKFWEWLKGFFAEWYPVILGVLTGGLLLLPALIFKNWDTLKEFFTGLWTKITEIFTPIGTWFQTQFDTAWTNTKNAFSAVTTFFTGIWGNITGAFDNVGTWFKTQFDTAWTNIKNSFSTVGSFFGGIWTTITEKFTGIGTAIGDAVGGAFKTGVNTILGTIENVVNGFFKNINSITAIINKIPGVNIGKIGMLEIPRLKVGMDYVPSDYFPAYLDKGERVLTAEENIQYNKNKANEKQVASNTNKAGNVYNFNGIVIEHVNDINDFISQLTQKAKAQAQLTKNN